MDERNPNQIEETTRSTRKEKQMRPRWRRDTQSIMSRKHKTKTESDGEIKCNSGGQKEE